MHRLLALVTAGPLLFAGSGWAQAGNACDLNQDGIVNVVDGQLVVNMYLGLLSCTANIEGAGVCNTDVVNRVMTAALGGPCVTGVGSNPHTVSLAWTASTSNNIQGYNVYRGTTSGGPYPTKINATSLVSAVNYADTDVIAGTTYYYVATAVDINNNESIYSSPATAVVPTP